LNQQKTHTQIIYQKKNYFFYQKNKTKKSGRAEYREREREETQIAEKRVDRERERETDRQTERERESNKEQMSVGAKLWE